MFYSVFNMRVKCDLSRDKNGISYSGHSSVINQPVFTCSKSPMESSD